MLKIFRSAACAHGREARRVVGAFIPRCTKSVRFVRFRLHSRAFPGRLPGLAFARPRPLRFTSPKSLSRGSKFLFYLGAHRFRRFFFEAILPKPIIRATFRVLKKLTPFR